MPKQTQPQRPMAGLTPTELKIIAFLLQEAAERLSGASSNDFFLPATDEHKAIFAAVLERNADKGEDLSLEEIMEATDEVFMYDDWVMSYFAERCQQLADASDPQVATGAGRE